MSAGRVRQLLALTRALPRVAPWRPFAVGAAVFSLLVMRASTPDAALSRLRVGAAVVAACAAFVLDDAAAPTLASAPTTLRARRAVRTVVALVALAVWWVAVALAADASTGSGRPSNGAALEMLALVAVALAVASLAARREEAARGFVGATVALACFASAFLPPRWWWPLTPDPASASGTQRLIVLLAVASVAWLAASVDPARRARLRFGHSP